MAHHHDATPGDTLSRVAEPPEDDWFPEADVRFSRGDARASIEDEWFVEDDPRSRGGSFDPWRLADRRVLVPAGSFLVFLIALLAAAGAFESSPRIAPPTVVAPAVSSGPAATTTPLSVAATTPAAAAVPTTPLKPGDAGAQVKLLQEELTRLGYSVVVDGSYGSSTTQAVVAFQKAHGLAADGVVGSKTLMALAP